MFVDGRQLPDGTAFRGEVAVVGAGPAGIVVALELAQHGHSVLLVESGGVQTTGDESLGTLAYADPLHRPMALATARRLGGASNLWGGRCVPFDPVDFEPRVIVGGAHWPISYRDVAAYYQRACEWCCCGDAVFDARAIPALASRSLVPGLTNADVLATGLERWSLPTNFGSHYRELLRNSRRITMLTHLTCTEVVPAPSDPTAVSHLLTLTPDRRAIKLRAAKYVISCGGLETTRLLFASRSAHPTGIGNHSGHLGRWYMAHVDSSIARVRFTTDPSATIHDHERDGNGVYVRRRFTFAPEVLRAESLSNAAIWLVNPAVADPSHGSAVLSFVYLALASPFGKQFISEGIRQAHVASSARPGVAAHLTNVVHGLPAALAFAVRFGYQRYLRPGRKVPGFFVRSSVNEYELHYHGEHLPNPSSFVEPSRELDSLGMPRLTTHTAFSAQDVENVIRAHRRLGRYLARQGVGAMEFIANDTETLVRNQLYAGYHQAGTTRMSSSPDDGVVDQNLAVHGLRNLFVASSSVFVTSSQANSTFTLLALAARLADHLHETLV